HASRSSPSCPTIRPTPTPTLLPYTTLFRSFSVLDECATGMGSRLLRHWLHHPLRDHAALAARHQAVAALADAHTGIHKLLRRFADRKSTRLNSSHGSISYAVFCLKKKRQ